jgi:hypothetical protein
MAVLSKNATPPYQHGAFKDNRDRPDDPRHCLLWLQIDLDFPLDGVRLGITARGQRGVKALALDRFHWIGYAA